MLSPRWRPLKNVMPAVFTVSMSVNVQRSIVTWRYTLHGWSGSKSMAPTEWESFALPMLRKMQFSTVSWSQSMIDRPLRLSLIAPSNTQSRTTMRWLCRSVPRSVPEPTYMPSPRKPWKVTRSTLRSEVAFTASRYQYCW